MCRLRSGNVPSSGGGNGVDGRAGVDSDVRWTDGRRGRGTDQGQHRRPYAPAGPVVALPADGLRRLHGLRRLRDVPRLLAPRLLRGAVPLTLLLALPR